MLPQALGLGLAAVQALSPAPHAPTLWRLFDPNVLGAPANFLAVAHGRAEAEAAIAAALAEIERLNGVFNSRQPSSELSRLNAADQMAVSFDLFAVLSQAEAVRALSGGAFNPGLGAAIDLWRAAGRAVPQEPSLRAAAVTAQVPTGLDAETRIVTRPPGVRFALDGLAKGHIVDRALAAGLAAAPAVRGMLVDIGGDMACAGIGPDQGGWRVGVSDPLTPYANAPLAAEAILRGGAIAASGRGPRDRRIGGQAHSATLDPLTGGAARRNAGASVIAPSAILADALATALLVMPAQQGLALVEGVPGAAAWIADLAGAVHASRDWGLFARETPRLIPVAAATATPDKWLADWVVELNYKAPGRQETSDPRFRSPYMALWISDKDGHPIRTIMLVGTDPKYQEENFIWWTRNHDQAQKLVQLRAGATSLSGRYALYWPGYDDAWKFVPLGEYVLNVETSQEHGQHTFRTLPLVLGRQPFKASLPPTREAGGLEIVYGKRE